MIPTKINNLFSFIDFLHSNIENFNLINPKIDQFYKLCNEKSKYYNKGFHEQQKYNELQVEVVIIWNEIQNESILKILNKANDLGLNCVGDYFSIDFNAIENFRKTAIFEDLEIIEVNKNKYLDFRKKSLKVLGLFHHWTIEDLDEKLVRLFEYFSKDKKEFDFLKPKPNIKKTSVNVKNTTPKNKKEKLNFDPKQFNKKGVKLFEYLIENYAELTKTRGLKKKLSNLWHFMKNDNSKKDSYKFYFTKDEYKAYILKEYKIKITNTDKSPNKYAESDLPQLKNHVIQFEDLKKTE